MYGRLSRVVGQRRLRAVVVGACVAVLATGPARGASGELDAGFGRVAHGRVVVPAAQTLLGVVVQSNGGIIGVGRDGPRAVVVRLRPDGTRDARFGTRTLAVAGGSSSAFAVALQEDRKILVVGGAGGDMGVWRLRPSGALDRTFSTDGFATFGAPTSFELAYDVAVDARGRVVVAGSTSNGDDMIVVRFTSRGLLDRTFHNVAGTPSPYFQISGPDSAGAFGVAVQQDGKILLTGFTDGSGLPVYRIRPGAAGAPAVLDRGFGGGDGLAEVDGLSAVGFDVALQRKGKIVVAGQTAGGSSPAAVRLTPAGVVDGEFGSGTGVHLHARDATAGYAYGVAAVPGGGVAVTGTLQIDGTYRAFVARLNARGARDRGMGPGGVRLLNRHDVNDFIRVAVQPDGRIVTAGSTTTRTGVAGVVYRLMGGLKRPMCGGKKATIVGTKAKDHLVGTRQADVIAGRGGGDTVKALGRGDIVCGGPGRDTLRGGRGADTLLGGRGRDTLEGGPGHDRLQP